MEQNILRHIFFDKHNNWEQVVEKHKKNLRPKVLKEVEKIRGCGNPRNGLNCLFVKGVMT